MASMTVDFTDPRQLQELWEEHVDDDTALVMESDEGDTLLVSAVEDKDLNEGYVAVVSLKDDGWVRTTYYWLDGTVEEKYEHERL